MRTRPSAFHSRGGATAPRRRGARLGVLYSSGGDAGDGPVAGGGDVPSVGAGVPGAELQQRRPDSDGQQQRGARFERADRGGLEDVLAAQADLLAGVALAVGQAPDRDVVLPA
ncbi:hypothetical protein ACIBI0_28500 [Microbispora rosea]|uniref:hypothetical protein n=1 Tax=Microbispora rosea TaxID=58117 RepID=UPI0037B5A1BD